MRKLSFLTILSVYLFSVSCSDDTTTNPPSEVDTFIFPLAIGNEWEFDFYWLDAAYEPTGEVKYSEKSKIIKKLDYRGKEAYQLDEDLQLNIEYLSVDNDAIYGHVQYNTLSSDGKNYLPDEWMTLYKFGQDKWEMYKKEINNIEEDYTAEGTITANAEKSRKYSEEIEGNIVDVYEIMTILHLIGSETYEGQTTQFNQIDTSYMAFADGIGIFYFKDHDYPTEEDPEDFGWIRKVGNYTIK